MISNSAQRIVTLRSIKNMHSVVILASAKNKYLRQYLLKVSRWWHYTMLNSISSLSQLAWNVKRSSKNWIKWNYLKQTLFLRPPNTLQPPDVVLIHSENVGDKIYQEAFTLQQTLNKGLHMPPSVSFVSVFLFGLVFTTLGCLIGCWKRKRC